MMPFFGGVDRRRKKSLIVSEALSTICVYLTNIVSQTVIQIKTHHEERKKKKESGVTIRIKRKNTFLLPTPRPLTELQDN